MSVRAGTSSGVVVAALGVAAFGSTRGCGVSTSCGGRVLALSEGGRGICGISVPSARICRKRRSLRAPGSSTRAFIAPASVQLRSGG